MFFLGFFCCCFVLFGNKTPSNKDIFLIFDKCETCTCIICKLSLVWYKRIYHRCMFLPRKRVAVWKQMAIKVNFLSILSSHNVLKFDCSQKASNFKAPPLFNLNVYTHNDALKNDALHWQKVQKLCGNSN